jgi:hypothetical protein
MFKTLYLGQDLVNRSKVKTPLGDKIKKADDFYGDSLVFPVNYGLNWGIAPTLTASTPTPVSGKFKKWVLSDTKQMYGKLTLDNLSMKRASKDVGAYLRLKAKETSEIVDNMKMQRLGHQVWGSGNAVLARVESVTGGGSSAVTAIVLTNYKDAVHFDSGDKQTIRVASGAITGLRTGVYTVTKVNRYNSSGKAELTVAETVATVAGDRAQANDYIFNSGFYDTTLGTNALMGIQAWIPTSDPSSDTFFGVDRTSDMQMLAGWRGTWEGSIRASAERLASIMGQYFDTDFSALWLSNYRWWQLKEELSAEGRFYIDETKSMEFGTAAMRMITPSGSVVVVADPYAPNDAGYFLRHDDITIHSTGPLIHLADEDLEALRMADADGLEMRYRSAAELRVGRPFLHGNFAISST